MRKLCIVFLLLGSVFVSKAQIQDSLVLTFREYIGYVKQYHPVAKQAGLQIDQAQANLMKSRGGFDPKLEVDYDRKEFKDSEYYDILNATFKIPTWYGIELKAGFEQNEGEFLNPERFVPDDGLYNAGVSVSLGKGLWMNERMATLKKAKIFRLQSEAERDLLINQILFEASQAYFKWLKAYREFMLFDDFLVNATIRLDGVARSAKLGALAAIDTVEARIPVRNRELSKEQARVELRMASLELSAFLWLEENIPVELQPEVIPNVNLELEIDPTLQLDGLLETEEALANHPKMQALNLKIDALNVDRQLKANNLLPRIDLEYNFLSETPDQANTFNTAEYKGGINFSFPLFLRKERGDLKLAKLKITDMEFDRANTEVNLRNKINALRTNVDSFTDQLRLIAEIVEDYRTLLRAEERKFGLGESSLFLINSRETKLIEAELKQIEVRNKFFETKAKLFNTLALVPQI